MTVSRYIYSIIILFFGITALQAQTAAGDQHTTDGIPLKAEAVNPWKREARLRREISGKALRQQFPDLKLKNWLKRWKR